MKANPELIPGLVDEAIRWMTPVKHFMRTATADTDLGGRKIAKGDWLMLCYASGNRDEEVFEEPYQFRSDRKPNRHLAFGYGAHLCLGQYLAKMEMRILFEELLPRLKSVALDGEVKMTQANFVNGPKKLPIRFEADVGWAKARLRRAHHLPASQLLDGGHASLCPPRSLRPGHFPNGAAEYTTLPPTIVMTDLILPISFTGAVK